MYSKGKKLNVKQGYILLAQPFMMDPNFKRSVVLLCEHQEDGSIGFILNKPLNMKVDNLISDFPEFAAEVYYGGPVSTDTIHYVHDKGDLIDDSVEVEKGIYWGGDYEQLKFLITSKLILPGNIRFFVGYSGWSTGQLKDELRGGSWIPALMDANYLFSSKTDNLWRRVMHNKGENFTVLAELPDPVCLN